GSEHSGMDHSQMNHETMPEMDHSKMSHEAMPAMDHTQMGHVQQNTTASSVQKAVTPVYGWANASTPKGDKALQYSDLKSLEPQKDTREATSEL
ncbi:copper oxidase, partial [bacterium LRH843]|nr:copper oxidase [bacterium LRH843]